jgi:membrane protease subunit (stomatin/prohibitin family)
MMREKKNEVTEARGVNNLEFCEKCGCQKDEDSTYYRFCEDCLEEWAEENEVYL